MTTGTRTDHDRFVHPALFYRSDQEYLQGLVPFIAEGLACGDPVAAAVPGAGLALLRQALGRDATRVRLLDMTDAGRNPGRIIAGVLRAFADTHPDRHVRIIGEPIWPGRTPTEYPACAQHEALINTAFAGRDVTIVCPYNAARLEPQVLADAEQTHPLVWDIQARRHSPNYAPHAVVDRYNLPCSPGMARRSTPSIPARSSRRCGASPSSRPTSTVWHRNRSRISRSSSPNWSPTACSTPTARASHTCGPKLTTWSARSPTPAG